MKHLQRYFSLLLCCIALLGVFSLSVSAKEHEKNYYIYTNMSVSASGGNTAMGSGIYYPKDSTRQNYDKSVTVTSPSGWFYIEYEMYITNSDKTALFEKDDKVSGSLENIYFLTTGSVSGSNTGFSAYLDEVSGYVIYTDGSTDTISCSIQKDSKGYYFIDFDFTADKDVYQIYFQAFANDIVGASVYGKSVTPHVIWGEPTTSADSNTNIVWGAFSSEVETAETTWLGRIWGAITDGLQDLANKVYNIWAYLGDLVDMFVELLEDIGQLPVKIWNYIETGLQDLFVPDEGFLVRYKMNWTTLMADKLGAVWQVTEVLFDSWGDIGNADDTDTIYFPAVTIPLPDNNTFTFGGYDVKIVPDGFSVLATAVKMICGIVCTLAFINGLRKRYDEVMGVEQ